MSAHRSSSLQPVVVAVVVRVLRENIDNSFPIPKWFEPCLTRTEPHSNAGKFIHPNKIR